MDIASLSMSLAMSRTLTDVGTAMLSKTLDMQKIEGNGVVEMMSAAAMENSVTPYLGGNFDMSV